MAKTKYLNMTAFERQPHELIFQGGIFDKIYVIIIWGDGGYNI